MRRPVGVKWFLCRSCLSLVSSQPSYQLSPPFHPHSSMSEFFRSVQVGCSRFSRCCHLIVDLPSHPRWKLGQAINAVTGTRRLVFVLPVVSTTLLPVAWPDFYCAAVHRPPHLPTGDAATPLTFERWPRWLVSFRFSLHARPTSGPSVAGRYRLQTAPECGVHPAPAASADTDLLPCSCAAAVHSVPSSAYLVAIPANSPHPDSSENAALLPPSARTLLLLLCPRP